MLACVQPIQDLRLEGCGILRSHLRRQFGDCRLLLLGGQVLQDLQISLDLLRLAAHAYCLRRQVESRRGTATHDATRDGSDGRGLGHPLAQGLAGRKVLRRLLLRGLGHLFQEPLGDDASCGRLDDVPSGESLCSACQSHVHVDKPQLLPELAPDGRAARETQCAGQHPAAGRDRRLPKREAPRGALLSDLLRRGPCGDDTLACGGCVESGNPFGD